jgi:hypothetical protein
MERLNKEGLAYYHSLIKGMLEVTPEDDEAITEMVLGTPTYEEIYLQELDKDISNQLNEIIYGADE